MVRMGFDNDKYLKLQSKHIAERIAQFGGKLYLELGGKLFDDYHAARVLPGFQPDSKIRMLAELKDQVEIVIIVNADDIEKKKVRADLGISYESDALRLIDAFRAIGLYVGSVVLTRFNRQPMARAFQRKLRSLGIPVYRHYTIEGYPHDIAKIVSDEGFGRNDYIKTTKNLVVVTAPGPGSGKMATCLSQLYNEQKHGIKAGYAKFETFPIWNLPIEHPVNIAYEAATIDLRDFNMQDRFHVEAYGTKATNYNRDMEIFPVVNEMFSRIFGVSPYKSPTDMGVNMAGFCIFDDEAVKDAARREIVRRYYEVLCAQFKKSEEDAEEKERMLQLMAIAGVRVENRKVIKVALQKERETDQPAAAMELPNGKILYGKTSSLLGASASLLLNALKEIGGVPHEIDVISPDVIEPICDLKVNHLGNHNPRLHTDEVLIALSICATTDENAEKAMKAIQLLKDAEVHSSVILSQVDEKVFRTLGCNLTCEPKYQTHKLYHAN
ncbi:MAG: DUF1846 domain-containing protein [Christensenellales bacterium]|jgi:uncharacterized protein (UPF0371 family)